MEHTFEKGQKVVHHTDGFMYTVNKPAHMSIGNIMVEVKREGKSWNFRPHMLRPLTTEEMEQTKTKKKSTQMALSERVLEDLRKPELTGQMKFTLDLLIARGAEGITAEELFAKYRGRDQVGRDATRKIRLLGETADITTIRSSSTDDARYILVSPPPLKSVEQRTRESLTSQLVNALKREAGKNKDFEDDTVEESSKRDSAFAKAVRKMYNNVDFLGGTDRHVHAAMHIYGHARGGADLPSNGVLGDHNTNRQDEAGTLNFYVRNEEKWAVILEGYAKGEYKLPTLIGRADRDQMKWIILANFRKNIQQEIPQWFRDWVNEVEPDFLRLWETKWIPEVTEGEQ